VFATIVRDSQSVCMTWHVRSAVRRSAAVSNHNTRHVASTPPIYPELTAESADRVVIITPTFKCHANYEKKSCQPEIEPAKLAVELDRRAKENLS
jgi:hypothetical protein